MGRRMGALRYIGRTISNNNKSYRSRGGKAGWPGGRKKGFDSLFDAAQFMDKLNGSAGDLDRDLWEEYYTETIEAQVEKAGNAGQTTLLGDDYFGKEAKQYCRGVGSSYDPEAFISSVKNGLGDDYYNAISEIIEECAGELVEAWDRAFRNDGIGEKLFGGSLGGGSRRFASMTAAFSNYQATAARNFGANWNTAGASRERSRQSATRFLAANPGGTRRASPITASYREAASRNGRALPP